MKRTEGLSNGCGPKMAGYTLDARHSVCPSMYGKNVHDGDESGGIQTIGCDEGIASQRNARAVWMGPSESGPLASGSRCLNVGGNWNNGANAGVGYFNANNSLDNSNYNIGARLAYLPVLGQINIILGKDHASWQKIEQQNPSSGRRACGYARPNDGIKVDRGNGEVCL